MTDAHVRIIGRRLCVTDAVINNQRSMHQRGDASGAIIAAQPILDLVFMQADEGAAGRRRME